MLPRSGRSATQPAGAAPSTASKSRPPGGAYAPGSPASSGSKPWKQRSMPSEASYSRKSPRASSTARGVAAWTRVIASEIIEPELLPARAHTRLVLGGRADGGREVLPAPLRAPLELPRARRVDQDSVPEPGAELRDVAVLEGRARIDRRAEDPWEDHEAVLPGVHSMGERPVHLLVRGRIDVLLDDDDVLVTELGGARAPERGGDLLGLALVRLRDLDDDVHAVRDRRGADGAHSGNAGHRGDISRARGALDRPQHTVLAGPTRRSAPEA